MTTYVTKQNDSVIWKRLFIVAFFASSTLMGFIQAVVSRIPFIGSIIYTSVPFFIFGVLIIVNLRFGVFRYVHRADLLFFFFIFLLIILSGETDFERIGTFILQVLPAYYIGFNYSNDEDTLNWLEVAAVLSILINALYYYQNLLQFTVRYDMYRAYSILPHIMIVYNALFRHKKKYVKFTLAATLLLGSFYLSGLGSRGPLVIVACYMIINLLIKSKASARMRVLFVIVFGVIVVLIVSGKIFNYVEALNGFLSRIGVPTRALDLLLNGEFVSHTSGRDEIMEQSIEMINNKPFFGYGLWGQYDILNTYPHNYFIEIILHLGIPFGVMSIILYTFIVLKGYMLASDSVIKDMLLILSVYVYIRGFLSGTYLEDPLVFLLLGISLYSIRDSKLQRGDINGN